MNELKKQFLREEVYEAVWQTLISRWAPARGTGIDGIIKGACRFARRL